MSNKSYNHFMARYLADPTIDKAAFAIKAAMRDEADAAVIAELECRLELAIAEFAGIPSTAHLLNTQQCAIARGDEIGRAEHIREFNRGTVRPVDLLRQAMAGDSRSPYAGMVGLEG
jgi:hypothetical protein